ncbi:hypothetical protein LCGC14_0917470 [marine sediment metagenome]
MEDEKIIDSWNKNAEEWIRVIGTGQIDSRKFTNKAIENEVKAVSGNTVVDIGCGEGWLTRAISAMGKTAVGIDAIEKLLENARTKGSEKFYQFGYQDIIDGKSIPEAPFDVAVFNFCLYQKDGLDKLLSSTKNQLNGEGVILIQTLHPFFLFINGLSYKSQIISNSWKGLPGNFIEGHEWYARTFEDWVQTISESGLQITGFKEVLNEKDNPISLILKLK